MEENLRYVARPKWGEQRRLRNGIVVCVAYINDTQWWSATYNPNQPDRVVASMPRRETISWKSLKHPSVTGTVSPGWIN